MCTDKINRVKSNEFVNQMNYFIEIYREVFLFKQTDLKTC